MKKIIGILVFALIISCNSQSDYKSRQISLINLKTFTIENCDIRAMTPLGQNIGFAGSEGIYGFIDTNRQSINYAQQLYKNSTPTFRAVASTQERFFMLSIDNPALLFTPENKEIQLIYREENKGVFYDSMQFLDENNGIAVGDAINGCMSVIKTTDGGVHWQKSDCENAPKLVEGEALFAASNSNIAITEEGIKVITGGAKSRVFLADTNGKNWESYPLPLLQGKSSQGAFSINFYDNNQGFVVGGDYLQPKINKKNTAITSDGGKTWKLIKNIAPLGYLSCVKYVPESQGHELIACGPSGIWFTNDKGKNWNLLDKKSYHALLIINGNTLVASENEKITIFRIVSK